eukprot:1033495-Prymnesium_polylepis.2
MTCPSASLRTGLQRTAEVGRAAQQGEATARPRPSNMHRSLLCADASYTYCSILREGRERPRKEAGPARAESRVTRDPQTPCRPDVTAAHDARERRRETVIRVTVQRPYSFGSPLRSLH